MVMFVLFYREWYLQNRFVEVDVGTLRKQFFILPELRTICATRQTENKDREHISG